MIGLRRSLRVGPWTREGGGARILAQADRDPLWFESHDVELSTSATALACLFYIPALHHKRSLVIEGALSREWQRGARKLQKTYAEWWGYPRVRIRSKSDGTGPATPDARERVALTFSGGVDSFYTLLRGGRPDGLVFVRGFDMGREDHARWSAFQPTLRAVSEALGVKTLVIETNLREHALFDSVNWERTHGGALAAIGHLLSRQFGVLRIAATLTREFHPPWGSHPHTDALWGSEQLRVEDHGTELWRHEKLWEIQDEPLVQQHLRVCWENRTEEGNCSQCDKCLITMLALAARDRLGAYSVFRPPTSFVDALDHIPQTRFLRTSALLAEEVDDPGVRAALTRLRERTLSRHGT